MVLGEVVNGSTEGLADVIVALGQVGLFLQALGIIVVLWIVFQIVTLIMNRKRRKALYKIKDDLGRLEKKIDRIEKKLK